MKLKVKTRYASRSLYGTRIPAHRVFDVVELSETSVSVRDSKQELWVVSRDEFEECFDVAVMDHKNMNESHGNALIAELAEALEELLKMESGIYCDGYQDAKLKSTAVIAKVRNCIK